MQFEKRAVRLGDIRPSSQNPREDFGDIGALARSIEATGGEPLNPPVVVADGNVFRIVDGERRYRALSSIYGEDREVSALVAESMDEANELVAMLATDDKRQLTEAERARGVQQMLVLGVDEQRIERASRATARQIRAARRLRGSIEGRQVTLEQLEAASAFDDEKDVEAVLAAGEGWADKADRIRRRIEREEAKAEDYDAFGDAGIPVAKEKPEGSSTRTGPTPASLPRSSRRRSLPPAPLPCGMTTTGNSSLRRAARTPSPRRPRRRSEPSRRPSARKPRSRTCTGAWSTSPRTEPSLCAMALRGMCSRTA